MKNLFLVGVFTLSTFLVACAPSAPLAPSVQDDEAKQYQALPGYGAVYIYRKNQFSGRGYLVPITVGDQLIGHISEYEYLRIDAEPGRHKAVLEGGRNSKPADVVIEADTVYFVEFLIDDGYGEFHVVDDEVGKKAIKKRELARKYISGIIPALPE